MVSRVMIDDFITTSVETGYDWFLFHIGRSKSKDTWYEVPFDVSEIDWTTDPPKEGWDFPYLMGAVEISRHTITEQDMRDTIEKYAKSKGLTWEELYNNFDANNADDVMQLAVFGEIRYG